MNIVFFDLETQYLFQDLGMLNYKQRDPTRLKLAIAGIFSNSKPLFFNEDQTEELFENLNQADLIVGHNLLKFDYLVLKPYLGKKNISKLEHKTLDTFNELKKITGCYISLDDLGKRNLGMEKNVDTMKIPKMWRDGNHQEVKDYLLNDLKMTEAIYNHGKKNKKFKYDHKEYGKSYGEREVFVDW